ncbi:MAG: TlyA family RNA methyltransferase [Clostridiales bacterium]|nr:TlyA family RNA methyltransferase [Clostridiales bacterium]
MARRRVDTLLAERGIFASRERARAAVMAGEVRVDGQLVTKAGERVDPDAPIEVTSAPRFVSRGGEKLVGALEVFGIDVTGVRAVDVGASTGGFTDCLLQRGASTVAAVDVGYGQLAWSLRTDSRVTVFERTNIRSVDAAAIGAPFDLAVVDVSFIGLPKVMPHVVGLLGDRGQLLALVKPQFDAGKGRVGKRGVVRDPSIHAEVLEAATQAARREGLVVRGLTWSPLKGPNGNIEFWLWAGRDGEPATADIAAIVSSAHHELGV